MLCSVARCQIRQLQPRVRDEKEESHRLNVVHWSSTLDPPRLCPLVKGTTVGGMQRRIEAEARAELRNRCGPYLNSGSMLMQPG
jgi:hypothetical protein